MVKENDMETKFNTVYLIKTKDGQEYEAKLIKLNKYCGKLIRWRREGDVPHKQRYLRPDEVVEVSLI